MTAGPVIVRVDATSGTGLKAGTQVRQGQRLGSHSGLGEKDVLSPVSGTVESIRFDPQAHEFRITVKPQG
jgi:Na+-translocating ferredoxin:NAD+ oxidoreductase RnfC subunit